MTADEGVWLYSITTDSIGDAQLAGVTGVAGEPVRAVASAGLVAVVGTVSLSEFGQEPLQRNLEDLDWLAATARAHDSCGGCRVALRSHGSIAVGNPLPRRRSRSPPPRRTTGGVQHSAAPGDRTERVGCQSVTETQRCWRRT